MAADDFSRDEGFDEGPTTELVVASPETNLPTETPPPATNMREHRANLVRDYHHGASSLAEKLRLQGRDNSEAMVMAIVAEIIQETDHLLGNELVATEDGELRDASVISTKRAEVLDRALKAVQTKLVFDRDHGIDVESPAMRVIFKFFMSKVRHVFKLLKYSDEASDTFFRTFASVMDAWEGELKTELQGSSVLNPEKNQR